VKSVAFEKASAPATMMVSEGRDDEQLGSPLGATANHPDSQYQSAPVIPAQPRTRGGSWLVQQHRVDPRIADAAAITISITIAPVETAPGRYQTRLDGRLLVTSSTSPFFDSARVLIAEGFSPSAVLEGRRNGRPDWDLRALLGVAAGLVVRETANGPICRPLVAPRSMLERPPIASTESVGTKRHTDKVMP
jgi:hypothetical protein